MSTSSPTLGQPFGITFWDNLPIFPPSIHIKSQTPTWALSLGKFSQMAGTWPEGPGTAAAPDLFSSMGRKLVKKPRQGTLCLRLSLKSPYYSYKSLYFKMEISMVCFFFTREIFLSWLIFFFFFWFSQLTEIKRNELKLVFLILVSTIQRKRKKQRTVSLIHRLTHGFYNQFL